MASTSTNKQPLLVDNVLHNVVSLNGATVPDIEEWETSGSTNSAVCIVQGSGSDGAIIEDIYTISRDANPYTLVFFLSGESDYLRKGASSVVGYFTSTAAAGKGIITHYYDMPYVLAPVPAVSTTPQTSTPSTSVGGDALKYKALYIPRGQSLWVGIAAAVAPATAPYVGVQGGWY
tara:strand:- start:119 stop:646 length:528 start_codon:yes stop_codon:yes gene_type:complete